MNYAKLRVYLKEKYNVTEAYYFLGFIAGEERNLYLNLQRAGFILFFREHSSTLKGSKKGNVDCDIVFEVMRKLVEKEPFDKVFIISGDGDYKKLVDFLIEKGKFGKMLFPSAEFASSLYKKLGSEFYDHLESKDVKKKICYNHLRK